MNKNNKVKKYVFHLCFLKVNPVYNNNINTKEINNIVNFNNNKHL